MARIAAFPQLVGRRVDDAATIAPIRVRRGVRACGDERVRAAPGADTCSDEDAVLRPSRELVS